MVLISVIDIYQLAHLLSGGSTHRWWGAREIHRWGFAEEEFRAKSLIFYMNTTHIVCSKTP
jgi:hypothetical protein